MTLDHTIRGVYINTLLDGGYTRLDRTINPTEGYIVGGVTKESKMVETFVLIDDHYAEFKELWHKYDVLLHEHTIGGEYVGDMGIGTWVHDGAIYFDLVQHIHDLDVATSIAKERGEIAIYDCKNQKDILL
tara:strand:+ start:226 stop:618 length:393 start_codon:yes stop_codon:yes gene_type:complete